MTKKIIQLLLVLIVSTNVKSQIVIDSTNIVKTCLDCDSIGTSSLPAGSIHVEISGGLSPYTFILTGLDSANTSPVVGSSSNIMNFTQLCQDTFKLKITDMNGDSVIYNFTTIPPTPPTLNIDSVHVLADTTQNPDSGVIELFVTTNADSVFYKIIEQTNSITLGTLGGWQDSTLFDSLPGGYSYNVFVDIYPKSMSCAGPCIDSSFAFYSIYVPLGCENGFAFINPVSNVCVDEMVIVDFFSNPGSGENNFVAFEFLGFGDGNTVSGPGPGFNTYSQPGVYSIYYHMESTHGCVFEDYSQVTIYPKPVSNFNVTDNGGGNYSFSDLTSGTMINDWLWDFGDGGASSQSNPIHQYSTTGTYSVCLTAFSVEGCPNTYCANVNYSSSVGIAENTTNDFTVYPNPVLDKLTIQFKDEEQRELRILDITGKAFISQKITTTNQTINIAELAAGVYFLEVKTHNELKTIKLIKQ